MNTAQQASFQHVEELIIERAKYSYPRLPMLEVVFDRFALSLPQMLKAYLGVMTDVELLAVEYLSCTDALEGLPDPGLICVTDVEGWAGQVATVLEPELLFAVLEITFGGRTVETRKRDGRNFTAIEKKIAQNLSRSMLTELQTAFSKVLPTQFDISHIETNPKALLLGPPTSACVRARFSIEAEDRKGEFILVFPNASFEPVNHTLSQAFTGGQLGGDSGWRTKMSTSLEHTNIRVNAVMGETEVSLRDVLSWTPGTTLDFGMQADDPVMVVCAEKHIAMAEVGRRRNGKVALKITEQLYEEEELSNVLGY